MDLRKLCRICLLDSATVDITQHKASVWTTDMGTEAKDYTIFEVLLEMFEKSLCFNLVQEIPMICTECLDNCLQNYRFFMKIKIANSQLAELYKSQLDLQTNLDIVEYEELQEDINAINEDELFIVEMTEDIVNSDNENEIDVKENLLNQDALIVSDFLPLRQEEADSALAYPTIHTIDYAAVALNRTNLEEYVKANRLFHTDIDSSGTSVYKCKYCPMAYASSEFLKTHMRKSHVCKYCTTAFVKVKDLNAHIRRDHSNHACVVCKKDFSSSSNLRAHLKHLHGIQLPAQVALLDYRPACSE